MTYWHKGAIALLLMIAIYAGVSAFFAYYEDRFRRMLILTRVSIAAVSFAIAIWIMTWGPR